ncbi:arylsulfatase : Sulfatase OS=Planctomyces limnophilus (strain ATCC 43296 / DSM 3776 / IFAM 1008 / 290) GN=Plim_3303 PE=4 SV=1: Sulfatase [Gemmataceae bacterium]|nr:arylsulfatase : Sulfatase OS=Planctomyces limnophilus (strain ATCC 43296 / DSM 3776 / IFAM 1008 / 290) GN=Plim_3303 PE=4 SV=1: Sulfatase [Gemmataceae bacterium]VTU00416.1 arylsulfatase : Sulfatase OS=Planctomyces limnophilus (strain ATCC 43296 / DSM 3776 / IFAM 1008 / 290) GN=Plim_3303 PE=4 SV=1: Sulfatase [Gemmataceae bacterium]
MATHSRFAVLLALGAAGLAGFAATGKLTPSPAARDAQQAPAEATPPAGSPAASTSISGKQLPPPDPKFGGVIKDNAAQSKTWWAPRVVPPTGAPNVLLIMTDDVGFGAPSTFGGVIPTPSLDRIAKAGLRYTNMHSTALCSPTRAALITGRNHHSVGFGVISEQSTGFPGYNSIIQKDKATIGRTLKDNGFATSWFGKNHNTPTFVASQAGPFDQWPIGMGFEYFYGFVGGDTSQWQPNLFRQTTSIAPYVGKPGWNLTTAMADDAIDWLNQLNQIDPAKPFFCYYVPGGTHAPHHPTPEWVKKISDMKLFDEGWNKLRERVFANQKKLGVIPADAKMTPWPKDLLKDWDQCTADEKKMFIRQVEVYAAYLAYTDHEIGRVIDAVEKMGKLDNTLVIYISGDNGSSAEGTLIGTPNEVAVFNGVTVPVADQLKFFYDVWGTERTYNHMAVPWTWAFCTPFSWTKQVASHFGGTRQGMCVSWPGRIKDVGGLRHQFHHVIDVVPTLLEVTGIPAPEFVDGIKQAPIEGTSFAYTFDPANARAPSRHKTQYFEMMGDHALYHEGWIASTKVIRPPWDVAGPVNQDPFNNVTWELYDLSKDWTQFEDVAAKFPDKVKELQALFRREAEKYQVLPLDASVATRLVAPRPNITAGRTEFVYTRPMTGVPQGDSPLLLNTSYTVTADIEVPAGGAEGVILTSGGRFAGYGFYLLKGKPVFTWNLVDLKRVKWGGPDALAPGKHTLEFAFKYDGLGAGTLAFNNMSGIGRSGTGVLKVDGKEVASQKMENTIPLTLQWDETFDVGSDTGTPVDDKDYQMPFTLTAKLTKLTLKLDRPRLSPADVKSLESKMREKD